jgi:hypothetical protein
MKMKKILSILLLIFCVLANGQSIKKGFKSLGKLEYDKAKNAFQEALSSDKDNIAANFGMALVLADDSSSSFDIINAWQYIERIEGKMGGLSQEDIEIITAYFLESEVDKTTRPVKKKIENALEAIESRLIKYIREENNLDAVYEVLNRYPNFRHYDNIIHIRNQFEFRKYEKQNNLEGYEEFIKKFPDAAQIDKAKRNRNQLAFDKAKSLNTTNAYTAYITQFPESEHIQTAIKLRNAAAFAEAGRINSLESYDIFISDYPDALEVLEAKSRQQNILYEKAKRVKSLQAYNDFILKYPEGQYFVDIFNLKAIELGTQFIREQNFTNPGILWARGYDNNGRIESGGAVIASSRNEFYIACNTRDNDTAFADAWVLKLDASGKMLWNKTIGQPFEDRISYVLLDSKENLIVLGYTWLSADSASRMGWMFKLGSDGKKIWNKNLGKLEINTCTIDVNDRIYIGGSVEKDTLGAQYLITIFNTDAKKIGERSYTGRGRINDLLITADGNMLLCGSNWLALMDPRRYIQWDESILPPLTATHCAITSLGDFYLAGANRNTVFYAKYSAQGKKNWFQNFDKADTTQIISDIAGTSQDNLLVLEQKSLGGKIKMFSRDGILMGTKDFPEEIEVSAILSDKNGMLLVLNNKDLMLIRFSQLASL